MSETPRRFKLRLKDATDLYVLADLGIEESGAISVQRSRVREGRPAQEERPGP
jgi:hypothetical protein